MTKSMVVYNGGVYDIYVQGIYRGCCLNKNQAWIILKLLKQYPNKDIKDLRKAA